MDICEVKQHEELDEWAAAHFRKYNKRYGNFNKPYKLAFEVTKDGEKVGVAIVRMAYDWCELKYLIVEENVRGQGVGEALLEKVEAYAREKGVNGVVLDTISFQAPDFYKSYGYEEYGRLKPYAGEYADILMKKVF